MRQLRVVDLCCGAGLFSLGLEQAGLKIVFGVYLESVCCDSFQENFRDAVVYQVDIMELPGLPRCDIVIGGPPCQPFSRANRRPDHKEGLKLVERFMELVYQAGPSYWILEEVPSVADYVRERVPRIELLECSQLGALNRRPRLFAGDFPDPVQVYSACENPKDTVMASETGRSIMEMRRLQGVPGWYTVCGSETEQRRQIGNAVPVQVGESLGRGIIDHASGRNGGGHQSWHRVTSAKYRNEGGNRAHLSIPGWGYCWECEKPVPWNGGNASRQVKGTPGRGCFGSPAPRWSGTPRSPRNGTPRSDEGIPSGTMEKQGGGV